MMRLMRSVIAQRSRAVGVSRFRPELEPLDGRWVPSGFQQTDLVADEPGVAPLTDPTLVNAWGISLSPNGGAFWLSAHGTGISPLYIGDVNGSPLIRPFGVTIPGGKPTGQVFNGTGEFLVSAGSATASPPFIFAGELGLITGWSPIVPAPGSRVAQVAVNNSGSAEYTGLAIGNNGTGNFLYAADFNNGRIDVFDKNYDPATLEGDLTDPNLPDRYAPFNVQNLGGKLYVTYARQDRDGNLAHGGTGFVSVFDLSGNFEKRLVSHKHVSAPWGLALAPADFGDFGGALLVGNHGDGTINAFDKSTGAFQGKLRNEAGAPIRIDGLLGLAFGNGRTAGDADALYFAAGPNDGTDGLFGSLRFVADDGATIAAQSLQPAASMETPAPPRPLRGSAKSESNRTTDASAPRSAADPISPAPTHGGTALWIDPMLDLSPDVESL